MRTYDKQPNISITIIQRGQTKQFANISIVIWRGAIAKYAREREILLFIPLLWQFIDGCVGSHVYCLYIFLCKLLIRHGVKIKVGFELNTRMKLLK